MNKDSIIRDCPPDLDESNPSKIVIQSIKGIIYKWREYRLSEKGDYCIVMDSPKKQKLSAKDAENMVQEAAAQDEEQPNTDQGYSLEPDDPRINRPTLTPIFDGFIPGGPKAD